MSLDDLEHRIAVQRKLHSLLQQSELKPAEDEFRAAERRSLADAEPPLPRWPLGLLSDFDAVFGNDEYPLAGASGLTLLAGEGGTGKSLVAMGCALENAATPGTCVCYLDAENTSGDQAQRAIAWFGGERRFREGIGELELNFHWIEIGRGLSYRNILAAAAARLLHDHERLLLIVDSINSLSRKIPGRVLDTLSRLYGALAALVRDSGGRIGVLALSELNSGGAVKGLEGVHDATVALKLQRELDLGDQIVRLRMLKNRNGLFRSDLGLYEIHAGSCRLQRWEEHGQRRDRSAHGTH